MFRYVAAIAVAVATVANGPAVEAKGSTASGKNVRLLLAPPSTLGSEVKSRATRAIQRHLEAGIRGVGGFTLVPQRELDLALRRSRKAQLRNCDGDVGCLTALGELLKAKLVVHAEVGGLGDVQVVYLKLIDAERRRELRSTTLELGRKIDPTPRARAAAMRLLAPKRFVGRLVMNVDVKGATIYVDGERVATSPTRPIPLAVGTHALRVTHPEFRDYVRFVSVEFDKDISVKADLQQFPIVSSGMSPTGKNGALADPRANGNVIYRGVEPTPWYRRWYTIAGAAAVLLFTSAVTAGIIADGIDADREKTVTPPR